MSDLSPIDLGPYVPDKLLATGTHAQVWLAEGPTGPVALKVARSDAHKKALLREGKALRACEHPRVVKLLDAAEDGNWIAMERVRGALIDRWALSRPIEDLIGVICELIEALRHVHAQGIVHGDLKPSNVIVDRQGHVRLLDLGIATLPDEEVKGFRGTLGYAAPELLRGGRPGRRADIYGLGALLYTCITGRKPFEVPDPAALTYVPLVSLPPPPSAWREDVPGALDRLVLTLVAREPTRRPTSLSRIDKGLRASLDSPIEMPVLGMADERDRIRRAVVGASDGECRIVVLYGPPGCGRTTLAGEAVDAARREGLAHVELGAASELPQVARSAAGKPIVVSVEASADVVAALAELNGKGTPGLFLIRSERPLPALGSAVQITPPPLGEDDALRLVRFLEGDPEQASAWWRDSLGHPISLVGRVRAWRRSQSGRPVDVAVLPATARRILELLRADGPADLTALAATIGVSEHALLDHCEVLFAEGLLAPVHGGAGLEAVG